MLTLRLSTRAAPGGPSGGTAYTIVQDGTIQSPPDGFGDHLLYVCNPTISTAALSKIANPEGVKLFYSITSLMPRYSVGVSYWDGLRAAANAANDGDFFHTASPPSSANRLVADAFNWYVRPSASLGTRLAAYYVATTNSFFQGTMADEMQADIPTSYWTNWKTAIDGPIESERAAYEVLWDAMLEAFRAGLKAAWLGTRALVCNSAGATYANADGITIETGHIVANGEAWALAQFEQQADLWIASATRYGGVVLSATWNHPSMGSVPGLYYQGTAE